MYMYNIYVCIYIFMYVYVYIYMQVPKRRKSVKKPNPAVVDADIDGATPVDAKVISEEV